MALLIRSWNVSHGNADPPRRRGYLRAMVELARADEPDVLCLQEVPVWAVPRLATWSEMHVEAAVARPPLLLGAPSTPVAVWPRERRVQEGVVLSDHAPVEVTVG